MWFAKHKKSQYLVLLGLLLTFGWNAPATALQSSSTSYGVDETYFGTGGVLCDIANGSGTSQHYCASTSAGDLAVGNTKSNTYQAQAGNLVTDRAPYIEVGVTDPNVDIGTLTTTSTHVTTATFYVKTYLAGGYTVKTVSPGPQNGSYTLTGMSTAGPSSIGNEQFGINLKANTCPSSAPTSPALGGCTTPGTSTLGAEASQNPDSTFGFGVAANGYNTMNQYKYVDGDTIASSSSSSGETDFTISYIYNVRTITPGGVYKLQQSIVATSTY